MIEGGCDCGAVRIAVAAAPGEVVDCQCDGCQRWGVLWAYYAPTAVTVTGPTRTYQRAARTQDFHFCAACGNLTHWTLHDSDPDLTGVNARLLPRGVRAAAAIRVVEGP